MSHLDSDSNSDLNRANSLPSASTIPSSYINGLPPRWTARHYVHAGLFAAIGVLTATIIPGFSKVIEPQVVHNTKVLSLSLPTPIVTHSATATPSPWKLVYVQSGQTLGSIFDELGLSAQTMHQILEHGDNERVLTRLKPKAELAFDIDQSGNLRAMRFDKSPEQRIELHLLNNKIEEKIIQRDISTRTAIASGEIKNSLYDAGLKAGLTPSAIVTLTDEVFQYDIDFDKDPQPGDTFHVVMDETWREGERLGTGKILAATYTSGNKTFTGFRFERDGKAEYFDYNGRPLKKSFIRMPISFARLSSRFGSRKHPILGIAKMHTGVDYAAPTGTPIMAAGDARVQSVGSLGGYGNAVVLDHGSGRTTLYAHMSRFGNIKQGQRISQGSVIGYVGATGLATGPHLHYEFRINGQHQNPLSVTMPPPEPLSGGQLAAFRAQIAPALAQIKTVESAYAAVTSSENKDKTPKTASVVASAEDKKATNKK